MFDVRKEAVIGFYDTHPINEDEILARVKAAGKDPESITEDDLKEFDQDHYGGIGAVDLLAEMAGISLHHHVLDVCSGMGGPARWIAHRIGCRVTGLDFTRSRVEGARRLTRRAGLGDLVDFIQGDATDMSLPDSRYDAVIGQEAWVHIADKSALIGECARVVKALGVIAFTDIVARTVLGDNEQARLATEMQFPRVDSAATYVRLLAEHRCSVESCEDLSEGWTAVLVGRLEMYRSLRETTVAKFGEQRYVEYDRAYSHFVSLFAAGRLGGVRVVARRAD